MSGTYVYLHEQVHMTALVFCVLVSCDVCLSEQYPKSEYGETPIKSQYTLRLEHL